MGATNIKKNSETGFKPVSAERRTRVHPPQ
jgi:hypothetical protein